MVDYLIGIGQGYLKSFIDFCADKIKDYIIEKIESIKISKVIDLDKFGKEFGKQLISGFWEITKKENYKEDPIFKEFDQNEIKKMITEILEKQNIINIRNEIENFKIAKINKINILLMGDQEKDIDEFMEIISKFFNKDKEKKNKFNIEFSEYFKKTLHINLIKFKNKENFNQIINCIWYFNKEPNQNKENKTNFEFNTNNLCKEIPIINIYFKNKISNENIETFYRLNIPKINLSYSKLFSNHIIDSNDLNEKAKEYILNLIEKTIINILIKNNKFNLEEKVKNIKEISLKKTVCFGNKINNLSILNIQIFDHIFKQFLIGDIVPNSLRKKYKEILHIYQNYLESRAISYYSLLLSKNIEDLIIKYRNLLKNIGNNLINKNLEKDKEDQAKLLYEIYSSLILFMNEMEFDFEDEDDKESKKKSKNNDMLKKVNSSCEDDIGRKIKILFDDYFLKRASNFINELIIDIIKDIQINNYNDKSRDFYIGNHIKKEYVFKDNCQ